MGGGKIKALLVIAFLLFFGYTIYTDKSKNKNKGLPTTVASSYNKPVTAFNQPEQTLPTTGSNNALTNTGVAPLRIKTSSAGGYNHFVKIINIANNLRLGSYFIRSGGTLNIKVPLGTYEIRYASGRKWYGADYLFGPDTTYNKEDSLFTFSFNGYQYSGYTVELIMQQNGNLSTSSIAASQW